MSNSKTTQARIHDMRESLLQDGTIAEKPAVTTTEAKKRVLKHLDLLVAALAGAHACISLWEQDTIFSESETTDMIKVAIKRLEKEMNIVPAIKDYFYCLGKHFDEPYGMEGPDGRYATEELLGERQIVRETLDQLEQLDREVDCILGLLTENLEEYS